MGYHDPRNPGIPVPQNPIWHLGKSTMIASQIEPADWYQAFPTEVSADSTLSRITTGATVMRLGDANMRRHYVEEGEL